ncbi:MAG: pyridoxine 5'-phosphate synthase [Phycisphaerales bacterium]|jgi:pyridoxine 5-phosphate synthase|nr:pyridoxine 5'-phosphate synthase [Phycisphaerales bacterium]MBT7171815.1 pyridoxine 5'-phosphate synthase [Phycisphaerales bacterium]
MSGLGVNIDHVATIRQARRTVEPDPVWAAVEAELAGASCITAHLRVDRRHLQDRDIYLLRQTVRSRLNFEMSLNEEIVAIAEDIRPHQASLVPENREEVTTEGGLDVVGQFERVQEVTERLASHGIVVSAFIDPVEEQIQAAKRAGCRAIELHTGTYANACLPPDGSLPSDAEVHLQLDALAEGLDIGLDEGLIVHAGHGLTYTNVQPVARLGGFDEFNIGHSIIARSVFSGLRDAVIEMKTLIETAMEAD